MTSLGMQLPRPSFTFCLSLPRLPNGSRLSEASGAALVAASLLCSPSSGRSLEAVAVEHPPSCGSAREHSRAVSLPRFPSATAQCERPGRLSIGSCHRQNCPPLALHIHFLSLPTSTLPCPAHHPRPHHTCALHAVRFRHPPHIVVLATSVLPLCIAPASPPAHRRHRRFLLHPVRLFQKKLIYT